MDYLIKSLVFNKEARVYIITNKETVNTAIQKHDLWPSAASILGKTMTISQMMGTMLKNDEALTIKIYGNGPIGNVIVDCQANGDVRGYVDHPHVNFVNNKGGLNDIMALGSEGMIDVIKDLKMKDLFTSSIEMTGDIAKDFTYYFYESEQTNSAVALGILIDEANTCLVSGGLIIQLLPFASENTISSLETIINKMPPMNDLLRNDNLEDILAKLFKDYEIIERRSVQFNCSCSKENFSRGLATLNANELKSIIEEDHKIETICHYCEEKYLFNEEEIKMIIKELENE